MQVQRDGFRISARTAQAVDEGKSDRSLRRMLFRTAGCVMQSEIRAATRGTEGLQPVGNLHIQ